MNIFDLAFKFDIEIEHDGDFDGGIYKVILKHLTCLNYGNGDTETKIYLKQTDIDELYDGVLKLAKALKPHVTEGY